MADGQVAVGHPDAVAPGDIRRRRVHIRICRGHIGHGREQHGIQSQAVHPVFQVDAPGFFKAAQTVGHGTDLIPRGNAALGHAHVFIHACRQFVFTVGQGARVVRENQRPINVGQPVEFRVTVGAQEIIERPRGQLPKLVMHKLFGHQSAGKHGWRAGAIAFAVGDQREVHFNHFSALGLDGLARGLPQVDHRGTGDDALPGGAADARCFGCAGLGVGIDIHARYAKAFAGQCFAAGIELCIGGRTHRSHTRNRYPGLQAPQVSTGISIFSDDHIEHFEQVGHGAGKGHHHVHGRRQRPVATYRNHAP